MELWIRSQNKANLILAKDIYINDKYVYVMKEEHSTLVGKYSSEKRALEVLDTIQNILQPKVIWREPKTDIKYGEGFIQAIANDMVIQTTQQVEYDLKQAGQIVYEMPEK